MKVAKMLRMIRAYRAGAPLGDVAVLKLDALSSASPAVAEKLAARHGDVPLIDVQELRALPVGSLGQAYAQFLDANGITPLVVSEPVRERFRDNPYALRYTTTHDLHHVLAGFDTGLAGEMGVLAFNVGQGVAPVSRGMLSVARFFYSLVSPSQAGAIAHNMRVGLSMGNAADLVIAAPIESYFEEPIDEVRARLHIPDPRAAGVIPSGTSILTKLLAPPAKAARAGGLQA